MSLNMMRALKLVFDEGTTSTSMPESHARSCDAAVAAHFHQRHPVAGAYAPRPPLLRSQRATGFAGLFSTSKNNKSTSTSAAAPPGTRLAYLHATEEELREGGGKPKFSRAWVKAKLYGSAHKGSQYNSGQKKGSNTAAGGGKNEDAKSSFKLTGMLRTFAEIFSVAPNAGAEQQPGEMTELGVISNMKYDQDDRCKYDISGLGRRPPSKLEWSAGNMVSKIRQGTSKERALPDRDTAREKAEKALPRWIKDHLGHKDNLGCQAPILRKTYVNHTFEEDEHEDENTKAGGFIKRGMSMVKKKGKGMYQAAHRKKIVYTMVAGHFDPGAQKEGISLNLFQRPGEDHNGAGSIDNLDMEYRHEECFAARDYEVSLTSGRMRDFRETVTHLRNNRAKKIDHVLMSMHGCPKAAGAEIEVIPNPKAEDKKNPEKIIDPASEAAAGYFFKELARALSWDHSVKPRRMPLFAEVPATVSPDFKGIQPDDILRSSIEDKEASAPASPSSSDNKNNVVAAPGLNLKAGAEVRLMRWKPEMNNVEDGLFKTKEFASADRKTKEVRGDNNLDVRKTETDVYILRFKQDDLVPSTTDAAGTPDSAGTTDSDAGKYFCEDSRGGSGNVVKAFRNSENDKDKEVITIPAWRPRVELSILAPRAAESGRGAGAGDRGGNAPEDNSTSDAAPASAGERKADGAVAEPAPVEPGKTEAQKQAAASTAPSEPEAGEAGVESTTATPKADEADSAPTPSSSPASEKQPQPAQPLPDDNKSKEPASTRSWMTSRRPKLFGKKQDSTSSTSPPGEDKLPEAAAAAAVDTSSLFRRPFSCTAVLKEKAVLGESGEWDVSKKTNEASGFLAAVEDGNKAQESGKDEEEGDTNSKSSSSSWNFEHVVQRDAVDIARKELWVREPEGTSDGDGSFLASVPTDIVLNKREQELISKAISQEQAGGAAGDEAVAAGGDAAAGRPQVGDVIDRAMMRISAAGESNTPVKEFLKDWREKEPRGTPSHEGADHQLKFELQKLKWRRPNFYNTLGTGVNLQSCSTAKEDESKLPHGDSAERVAGAEKGKAGGPPSEKGGGGGQEVDPEAPEEVKEDPEKSAILDGPPPQTVAHAIAKYLHTQRAELARQLQYYMNDTGTPMEMPQDEKNTPEPEAGAAASAPAGEVEAVAEMEKSEEAPNPKAETGAQGKAKEAASPGPEAKAPGEVADKESNSKAEGAGAPAAAAGAATEAEKEPTTATTPTGPASKGSQTEKPTVIPLRFTASNISSTWTHYRGINPLLGHCLDTATATMSEPAFVDFFGPRKYWEGPKTKRVAELLYTKPENQWMYAKFKNGGDDYHGYIFPDPYVVKGWKPPKPTLVPSWLSRQEDKNKTKTAVIDEVLRLSATRSNCAKAVIPSSDPFCNKDSSKGDEAGEGKEAGNNISPADPDTDSTPAETEEIKEKGDGKASVKGAANGNEDSSNGEGGGADAEEGKEIKGKGEGEDAARGDRK